MARRTRTVLIALAVTATALLATASPAAAQQPIDATEDGGAAFLAFAVMVFLIAGALFYMDRVRRRRNPED
jgi:hypothetical protein